MIVSIVHDPDTHTLTIVTGAKTVTLVYQNLPPGWDTDPNQYSGYVINFLNNQIELRTDRRTWLRNHDFKVNDPLPFTDSERVWLDTNSDEVVFMDVIVTDVIWSAERSQFLIKIKNTSITKPKV